MAQARGVIVAMELAERQRDLAAQNLARVRQARHMAGVQMEQLTGYAGETGQKLVMWGQSSTGVAPEVLSHHVQFMARLEQTIEMQRGVIASQDRAVQAAERQLQQAELRLTSLRQVLSRRELSAAAVQSRREQKETDELAAMRHRLNQQASA